MLLGIQAFLPSRLALGLRQHHQRTFAVLECQLHRVVQARPDLAVDHEAVHDSINSVGPLLVHLGHGLDLVEFSVDPHAHEA